MIPANTAFYQLPIATRELVWNRLYERAAVLSRNRRWHGIPGSDLWAYDMVDAVLHFLEKTPTAQPNTEAEYLRYALLLLYRFLQRHAWSRTNRHQEQLHAYGIPGLCSLEETREQTGDTLLPGMPDRYPALESSRVQIVQILENMGRPPARIWSFVWRFLDGLDWSEVQRLVKSYFHCEATEEQLRQWASRDLKRSLPRLKEIFLGEEPPSMPPKHAAKKPKR